MKLVFKLVTAVLFSLSLFTTAWANSFPDGPVTIVIPVAPGDGFDVAARLMSRKLSEILNVSVVVNNKPGAGGVIATEYVVNAPKDGKTILLGINPSLTFKKVLEPEVTKYDPVADLTSLGMAEITPSILVVRSDAPFNDFGEMIAFAKAHPGEFRIGTAGQGSIGSFCVAVINALTQADLLTVPFKGSAPAVTALRGGHIEGVIASLGSVSPNLKGGHVKGIAISSAFSEFPTIPTLGSLGYKQELIDVWTAFFAPAGIPENAISKLVPALKTVINDPSISAQLASYGIVHTYREPSDVPVLVQEERLLVEKLAKQAGLIK